MKHEEVRGQAEQITHQEMGVEETLLEELVGIKDFQVKEGVLPEEMVIKEEGEVMMILTLVMMRMGMIFPPLQTPLSQGKENRRDLDTFMYSKDLLVQKGQEGQPGQAGRDGRDGQDLSLTKVLEETLKAHKPNLDTTGLENSFDQFG